MCFVSPVRMAQRALGLLFPTAAHRVGPSSPSWAGAERAKGLDTGRSRARGKFPYSLTVRASKRRGEGFMAGGVSDQPSVDSENKVWIRLRFLTKSFFG